MKKAEKIDKLVKELVEWENNYYNCTVSRSGDGDWLDEAFREAEEAFFREYEGYDKYSRSVSDAICLAEEENKSFNFIKEMAEYWREQVEWYV